jgi:hypothetical protein
VREGAATLPGEKGRPDGDERGLQPSIPARQATASPGDQFGDLLIRPIPEKSIGATGFEPAT